MKQKKTIEEKINQINKTRPALVILNIIIILLMIIGLLNKGAVGEFLTYSFIFLFGAFYFVIFAVIIVLAIFSIIKRKTIRIHFNMRLVGIILIVLGILIAVSNSGSLNQNLRLNNFVQIYLNNMSSVSSKLFVVDSMNNLGITGGGFIGFFLCALLNTCITEIGTIIFYSILLLIGFVLVFKEVIAYIINFFKSYSWSKKEIRIEKVVSESLSQENRTLSTDTLSLEVKDNINEELKEDTFKEEPQNNVLDKEINNTELINTESKDNNVIEENKVEENKVEDNLSLDNTFTFSSFNSFDFNEENSSSSSKANQDFFKNENSSFQEFDFNSFNNSQEEISSLDKPIKNEEVFVSNKTKVDEVKDNKIDITKPKVIKKEYTLPPFDLLQYAVTEDRKAENERIALERVEKINSVFKDYSIGAQVISYVIGPSVTRFNVVRDPGVRVNTLLGVENEIAIALNGNKSVRIETVVEGRDTSSVEVGNPKASPVSFKEIYAAVKDQNDSKNKLLVPLGKDIEGNVVSVTIDSLPHLLVAGTTGSGKSVFVNTIIASLLMKNTPDELKLMLIDPKKVEFTRYNGLPHLLCPVITSTSKGNIALKKLCEEMDARYDIMSRAGLNPISKYNAKMEKEGKPIIPNIVVVIDEYSDFVSECGKEIEKSVLRLGQKARACGIYLIICTQRPSVDVITGTIKAVIPSKISLLVSNSTDSRIILDSPGAESLLGNGDMLCSIPKHSSLVRLQGGYAPDEEIESICDFIRQEREASFDDKFLNLEPPQPVEDESSKDKNKPVNNGFLDRKNDPLYPEIKKHVLETGIATGSNLSTYFSIGASKAEAFLLCLESDGIVRREGNKRVVIKGDQDNNEQ